MKNKLYLLIEEDNFVGNDYQVFTSQHFAKLAFKEKLAEHYKRYPYRYVDKPCEVSKFVEKCLFDQTDYILRVIETNVIK